MPDFLGIGAQKAGTTWLYFALAHHPHIAMPDCKEVHFWDTHHTKGYDWYEGLFEKATLEKQHSSTGSVGQEGNGFIKGEITPAYAILPPEMIQEIATRYPALKLIYMVRDPIARAWSAALMEMRNAELTFENVPDQWFLEQFNSAASRQRGDYLTCLKHWLLYFPKEQLLLLDYEAIKTQPREMLCKVEQHLGAESFFPTLHEKHLSARKNSGTGHTIRPALRDALEERYGDSYTTFKDFVKTEELAFFSA